MDQINKSVEAPVLFLSHGGGPCFFMSGNNSPIFSQIDKNSKCAQFLKNLQNLSDKKPKAIVIISAHWEENTFQVNSHTEGTELTYDYYGFPKETYSPFLTYAANSDKQLQEQVYQLILAEFGSQGVSKSKVSRGFDHGVFIPLKLAFPNADIPIVQVSCRNDLDFEAHYRLGKALSSLKNQNIWIIGSGQTTHNLSEIISSDWSNKKTLEYVEWLQKTLNEAHKNPKMCKEQLINMMSSGPNAKYVHPRTEHIVPLIFAYGAAFPDDENLNEKKIISIFNQLIGNMCLDSFWMNAENTE